MTKKCLKSRSGSDEGVGWELANVMMICINLLNIELINLGLCELKRLVLIVLGLKRCPRLSPGGTISHRNRDNKCSPNSPTILPDLEAEVINFIFLLALESSKILEVTPVDRCPCVCREVNSSLDLCTIGPVVEGTFNLRG